MIYALSKREVVMTSEIVLYAKRAFILKICFEFVPDNNRHILNWTCAKHNNNKNRWMFLRNRRCRRCWRWK